MIAKIHPIPGERFGLWTVICEAPRPTHLLTRSTYAKVACDCGEESVVLYANLRKGVSSSCRMCAVGKHGMTDTPEWNAWSSMLKRCYNISNENYHLYGGRGITVCDRWNPSAGGSFENFFADVGSRPGPNFQLDKEAKGMGSDHYGPDTTAWATVSENSSRRRNCVYIEYLGERMTLAEAARRFGLSESCLSYRIKARWPIRDALETPAEKRKPIKRLNLRYTCKSISGKSD